MLFRSFTFGWIKGWQNFLFELKADKKEARKIAEQKKSNENVWRIENVGMKRERETSWLISRMVAVSDWGVGTIEPIRSP